MEETLSKIFAIIIACLVMFIGPVKMMNERKNNIVQQYIYTETTCFADEVCNKGIIYEDEYEKYIERIAGKGILAKVSIERFSKVKDTEGEYTAEYGNGEITDYINREGKYCFNKGDIIRIVVKDEDDVVVAVYGGSVKDEDY